MSYEDRVNEFMEIMELLELPSSAHRISISVYKPEIMPVSLKDIMKLEADGIDLRFNMSRYSHSVTRNWYNTMMMMCAAMNPTHTSGFSDGRINYKDEGGTIRSTLIHCPVPIDEKLDDFDYGGTTLGGIKIGTGTTAESFDDFVVESPIANGSGAGQLQHSAMALAEGWNAGDNYEYRRYTRISTNASGDIINVTESAIYKRAGSCDYCISRDVFEAVGVEDGQALEAEYEFRLTYP